MLFPSHQQTFTYSFTHISTLVMRTHPTIIGSSPYLSHSHFTSTLATSQQRKHIIVYLDLICIYIVIDADHIAHRGASNIKFYCTHGTHTNIQYPTTLYQQCHRQKSSLPIEILGGLAQHFTQACIFL